MVTIYPTAALISVGLAGHGFRKGSLSLSGAIAACGVGYGHMANPLKVWGVSMIVFYLVGSRATKVKADVKAKLEDGPDPSKPGGNRDAIQVISNSLPSLLAALAFRLHPRAARPGVPLISMLLPRKLLFVALGHFATALADTLASELGILARDPPRHVLTWRPVPPGTNGGVSLLGLGASALGGLVMGATFALDLLLEDKAMVGWQAPLELVTFGVVSGLAGSLLDSVFGALLQATYIDTTTNRVLTDASSISHDLPAVKRIGFGINVLSNSAVNFVTTAIMAGAGWWYASL